MPAKFTQEEAVARRDSIIADAARVFAEKGYEGATVRDLENATGLTRGGLFFHFPSKRDLYMAAVLGTCAAHRPAIFAAALAAKSGAESFLASYHAILQQHAAHPEFPKLVEQLHARRHAEPELAAIDDRLHAAIEQGITQTVRELQRRGLFGPHVDAESAATVLHATMDRLLEDARTLSPEEAEARARRVALTIQEAFGPRGAA